MFTRGYRGIKVTSDVFYPKSSARSTAKGFGQKLAHTNGTPRWKHAYEYYEYNRKYNYINGNPKSLVIPMSHQVVLCLTYLKRNMYRNIRESTELGKSMKIPGFSFVQTHPTIPCCHLYTITSPWYSPYISITSLMFDGWTTIFES